MKTYTFTTEYDPTDETSMYHAMGALVTAFLEHNAPYTDTVAAVGAFVSELIASAPPEFHDAIYASMKERTAAAHNTIKDRKIVLQ